jgi:hypothetical protein
VTLVQTLYCQGNDSQCWKAFVRSAVSTDQLYLAARACGWQARPGGPDLCVECKEKAKAARRKPGTCASCEFQVEVEFRDSLGHDNLGHRTANTLASHGVRTWAALLDLKAPTLRKLGGLGDGAQTRIAWAQHHPKERFV